MHSIRTRPSTYFAGQLSDGHQALLGWLGNGIVLVLFNIAGELVRTDRLPLEFDPTREFGPEAEKKVCNEIIRVVDKLGFVDGPIRVNPFFLDDLHAGIRSLPEDLEDFLANPTRFSDEDMELFRADIAKWCSLGNCVLRWNNDYDLDSDGYTI